jgi:hypothetical protein
MEYFGYDIYLSKNIAIEEVEEMLSENYYERIFFYTNFMDKTSEEISIPSPGCSYFYLHQHQDILNSQFPFHLQIEALKNESDKWERAYKLVEKICKKFNVYCFIEYPYNTQNPSPYDVLLYMPNGEVHLYSDAEYEELGVIHPIKLLNNVRTIQPMQSKTVGELTKTQDWNSDNDWVSAKEISIPFFDNKAYIVRFEEVLSAENYFEKAEEAIQEFFNFKPEIKIQAAQKAFENWLDFNESCGFLDNLAMFEEVEDPSEWMMNDIKKLRYLSSLTSPDKVWEYINPLEIVVTKDRFGLDKEIYIQVLCNCDWEEEHGLQFIFKEGKELIRVSGQDGNLFE